MGNANGVHPDGVAGDVPEILKRLQETQQEHFEANQTELGCNENPSPHMCSQMQLRPKGQ